MKVNSNAAKVAQLRYQQQLAQQQVLQRTQPNPATNSVQLRMMESSFETAPTKNAEVNKPATTTTPTTSSEPQYTEAQMRQALENFGFKAKHLKKAKPGEIAKLFQKMQTMLTTPGAHKETLKIGGKKYKVEAKVGANGQIESMSVKEKKGFWSKLGGVLKKIAPIALKIASFIPGPVGIIARVATGVMGAIQGFKNGNILGGIASAAGAVAGGIAGFGGKVLSGTAKTIASGARIIEQGANAASNALAAVQAKDWGGLMSAIAGGASSIAGVIGDGAGSVAKTLENVATWANRGAAAYTAVQQVQNGDVIGAAQTTAALTSDITGR